MHALRVITCAAPLSLQGSDRTLQWRLVLRSPRRIRRHTVNLALIGVESICGASEGRGTRRQVLLTAVTGGGDPQLFQFARKAPVSPSPAPTTARHAFRRPWVPKDFFCTVRFGPNWLFGPPRRQKAADRPGFWLVLELASTPSPPHPTTSPALVLGAAIPDSSEVPT